jgi:hypothetical protein
MPRQHVPFPTFGLNHPAATKRRALLARLTAAADAGEPCPENAALGAAAGYACTSTVTQALAVLSEEGLIAIERRLGRRRVTICATGKQTATPPNWIEPPLQPKRPVRDIAQVAIRLSDRPAKDVLGRSRFQEHVRVRQVIFAFAQREGWPPTHAARVLGYDHSTACYSLKALPKHVAREPETRALIEAMQRELPPLPMVAA